KKQGALADAKLAAELKNRGDPVAVVAVKPISLASLWMVGVRSEARPPVPAAKPVPPGGAETTDAPPPAAQPPARPDKTAERALQLLSKEQPLILTVTRKPDQITVQASYTGLKLLVPKVTDLLIEMASQSQ